MPFCPRCGAEYIEGITSCAKCQVPLVPEPVQTEPESIVRVLPPWPRALVEQASSALRYAAGAWGLLRRHRSLLWLPVLIALFNSVERGVGQYLTLTQTAYGRSMEEYWRSYQKTAPLEKALTPLPLRLQFAAETAARTSFVRSASRLASSEPRPELSGLGQFVSAVLTPVKEEGQLLPQAWLVVGSAVSLLGLLLAAIVTAGFYAVLTRAVEQGQTRWREFWPGVGRYLSRLVMYYLLLFVLALPPVIIFSATPGGRPSLLETLSQYWSQWLGPLLALTLALAPIAIVVSDAPFVTALRRSAATIWRRLATTAVLLLATFALCWIVTFPFRALAELRKLSPTYTPSPLSSLNWVPLHAAEQILLAVIALWAVLALFLWYREAYPAPVPAPEPAPAE